MDSVNRPGCPARSRFTLLSQIRTAIKSGKKHMEYLGNLEYVFPIKIWSKARPHRLLLGISRSRCCMLRVS